MQDESILEQIIRTFFKSFVSKDVGVVDLDKLQSLFVPQAIIIKTCGSEPIIYSLKDFIEPRQRILTDGTLVLFSEQEITTKTELFGDIGHSFVLYKKKGVLAGRPFEEIGMKTFQFVRTTLGWKICSLAWDDERSGLTVPAKYL